MGLFDIFKKRNNEEENNNSKVEEVKNDETDAVVDDEQKTDDKVNQASEQSTVTSEEEQQPSDQEEDAKESDVDDNADEEKVEEQTSSEKTVEDDQTKFTEGLEKSRSTFGQRLNRLFANFRSVDEDFFEDLEDTLIESDVGFDMAVNLTDQLRDEVKLQNAKSKDDVQNVIIQKMIDIYDQNGNDENTEIHFADQGPTVILFVGVNGVGKTTTIGKMANMYKQQGKKVLLAAADTFRAGAIQQLDEWAKRDGVDIVKKPEQSDPSAVVYEAVHKAKDENYDILFVDTAGRLQNKVNLMNELAKMKKVLTREIPDAPHEVLLVLDSTTGQNALNQAKLFKETTNVSGIVLTKLDGTAKGGIVLAIRNELHVPVKYVGLGEKVEDLREFNANDFVYGLFKGLIK
ncbi:signal recognition particle-docking protein FtsY [Apilactobacillus kunkeei]|uniref:Signal recognition particle receptor FtsY n=1 Tax=Apilactobacillus kunkeei TaxID=148814 RepID=A0A1L8CJB7_9LACO|nr:signal recognition particle-docking protein FtsY [Apilactobacillus kunkeei]GAT91271.1 cell division protein FtsY [Apilactobacillus kunkeei]